MCQFQVCDIVCLSRNLYVNNMVPLDPAKSPKESGVWIDGYDSRDIERKKADCH